MATPVSASRIVITDCDHGTIDPELEILAQAGLTAELVPCSSPQDVIEAARDADAVITQYAPIDAEVIQHLERCKVIVRYGVGVETVDVRAASERGIWVANVPDYGVEEVADHALALLLAMFRSVVPLDRAVRSGRWTYDEARPLHRIRDLTIGVVGCGRIGTALATKVRCLGSTVLVADPNGVPEAAREMGVKEASLSDLLRESDAISVHVPLTSNTRGLFGAAELAAMKPTAFLVNTARGGIVDETALLRALDEGEIAGAGLDVLAQEPPDLLHGQLIGHDRVIVTPHSAWYSEESFETLKTEVAREVVRVLQGDSPRSPVNDAARKALR